MVFRVTDSSFQMFPDPFQGCCRGQVTPGGGSLDEGPFYRILLMWPGSVGSGGVTFDGMTQQVKAAGCDDISWQAFATDRIDQDFIRKYEGACHHEFSVKIVDSNHGK